METIKQINYKTQNQQLGLRILSSKSKVIAFQSLKDQEGKSMIAKDLAVELRGLNNKVCLVDLDLINDKPKGDKIYLNDYILGENQVEEIIHHEDGFDQIISYSTENSSQILAEKRLDELLEYLKHNYDIVLLDLPSLNNRIDAMLIAKKADENILVLERGKNRKTDVKRMLTLFERNNIKVLGVVLNK